ncbi:MAG: tRNA 2-thiocytidine biosynthesis protein TtcA [Bacteroidaceae bacterium]|nr:tRNA 2-thiocytidine biosynthesis protein TtcA [Bacteroidaceae bacterium]
MQLDGNQKLEKRLFSRLNKAMRDYDLIADGDKILIGLSGGKDSLALVRLLGQRAKISRPQFSVAALHVRMKEVEYESNTGYLAEFCRENGVELYTEEVSISSDSDNAEDRDSRKQKTPCFLCSWNRRKALFTKAQALGCNKIALGHHRDDIVHTTLLNLFFQGQFSTMPAKLRMRKMPLTVIRPLCLIDESDLKLYAESNCFQKQTKRCPHEHESNRTAMADLFKQIEKINPEARYCVMRALENEGKLTEE